jgi:CBS domain-containing protein
MSPRAAWRLERYGFTDVHDYVLGKADWLANDLPHEGETELVGDHLVRDLPTCTEDESVGDVRERSVASPLAGLVVVNAHGVVMGLLPAEAAGSDPGAAVGGLMTGGPTTVRPSEDPEMLAHRMEHADVTSILVTRPDGVLVGAFLRDRP